MLDTGRLYSTQYEEGRRRLEELAEFHSNSGFDRNEAATRLHLVDSLFFDCLGWLRSDAKPEEPHGGLYADYVFSAPRDVLIVEAKREGQYFTVPAGTTSVDYSLKSLIRDNPELNKAVHQVAGYCQQRGVPVACVCNGHQVVVFVAVRYDGEPPLGGRALVFPSFEHMLESFQDLWDNLSKPGIEEKNIQRRLLGSNAPELPPKSSSFVSNYPGVKNRNIFQTDLQTLSELVVEDLPRSDDLEEIFLRNCYSQSGALSQYALVSKNILRTRYTALFDSGNPGPATKPAVTKKGLSPDLIPESISRRPVLLIGDVGVGKTSFIRHLIKVEAPEIFQNAVTLYLDLGSEATLAANLKTYVLEAIASQLKTIYSTNVFSNSFVRGVYNLELKEFEDGIWGGMKDTDFKTYRQKEIEFLAEQTSDLDSHLRRSIRHISKGRQQQVIIFLDNSDQRDEHDQQQAFLIAQEIAEQWHAAVFVPLRPETYQRSVRIGALTGYHAKAFTIAPPRIVRVIQKRLEFAIQIAEGSLPIKSLSEGVSVELKGIAILIRAFLSSLRRNDELAICIDNIASGNVRLALDLVRGFFGSGHVNTEKILEIESTGGSYVIPLHEFLRAVIYGDSVYYDPVSSPVANVFDITQKDPKEHFLLPLMIQYADVLGASAGSEGFVESHFLYERLQALGYSPEQIDHAFVRAHRKRLLETAARRIPELGRPLPTTVRVSAPGKYHVVNLCKEFAYVSAMTVDTPILDESCREKLRLRENIDDRLDDTSILVEYLDDCWLMAGFEGVPFDWPSNSSVLKRRIESIRQRF